MESPTSPRILRCRVRSDSSPGLDPMYPNNLRPVVSVLKRRSSPVSSDIING